jgi:hypothetical protein
MTILFFRSVEDQSGAGFVVVALICTKLAFVAIDSCTTLWPVSTRNPHDEGASEGGACCTFTVLQFRFLFCFRALLMAQVALERLFG